MIFQKNVQEILYEDTGKITRDPAWGAEGSGETKPDCPSPPPSPLYNLNSLFLTASNLLLTRHPELSEAGFGNPPGYPRSLTSLSCSCPLLSPSDLGCWSYSSFSDHCNCQHLFFPGFEIEPDQPGSGLLYPLDGRISFEATVLIS